MSFANLKKTFRKHYKGITGAILTMGVITGLYHLTNSSTSNNQSSEMKNLEKEYKEVMEDHSQKQKEMYGSFIENLIISSFFMIDEKVAYAQPIDNPNLDYAKNIKLRNPNQNTLKNELEKMVFLADLNQDGNEDFFYGNFIPTSKEFRTTEDCTIRFKNSDGTFGKTIKTTSVAHYLKEKGYIQTINTQSIADYLRGINPPLKEMSEAYQKKNAIQ